MTACSKRPFSWSVVVGDSPVVPLMIRPSLRMSSTRYVARRAAPSASSAPSAVIGVIIAVSIRPKGAPPGRPADGCCVPVMSETLLRRGPIAGHQPRTGASEHRDDVLGVDVVGHVHAVDVP